MSDDGPDTIRRDPEGAAAERYDLVVVGGGIYGAMLLMEASLRGLRAVLLEKGDFGEATSFNSLRIVHGGLRYLQSADLPRFFESVAERRWYLRAFPDLVEPLPCLMPLYGHRLHRPAVLRLALAANDLLSLHRNRGVREDRCLPAGRVLKPAETAARFPRVRRQGLKGAAYWHDAAVPNSHRLIIEVIRFACGSGGTALNYVEGVALLNNAGRVSGVLGRDIEAQRELRFSAPLVVNATGPWVRDTAIRFGSDQSSLFHPGLAWNALFDRDALSDHALAVSSPGPGAHTYFLNPWKGRLLIGTVHSPFFGDIEKPAPDRSQVETFIADVNEAVPGLDLSISEINHIFCGLLPAADASGEGLAVRPRIHDHGRTGGPTGLFSVSGVKLTTARRVAAAVVDKMTSRPASTGPMAASALASRVDERLERASDWNLAAGLQERRVDSKEVQRSLGRLVDHESVVYREDLLMRRTTLWELGGEALDFAIQDRLPARDVPTDQAHVRDLSGPGRAGEEVGGAAPDAIGGKFTGSGFTSA